MHLEWPPSFEANELRQRRYLNTVPNSYCGWPIGALPGLILRLMLPVPEHHHVQGLQHKGRVDQPPRTVPAHEGSHFHCASPFQD